jgi:glycine cleavage system H protein
MNIPDNLKFTKEHEWVKVDGDVATVGVTEYAQEHLGDIVYAELPAEGEEVSINETFGALESVKAVSDCYSPVSGPVVEINSVLADTPQTINEDPYGEGWMIKIKMNDASELKNLMDPVQYKKFIDEESA